jgi:hypothetical protein
VARAAFWTLALVLFPGAGLFLGYVSSSFAVLLFAPALLTFFAGYALQRRSLEVATATVFSAIAGFGAFLVWLAFAIVFLDARPFD